ncbi:MULTISPECIES: TlpA disulfide reductase family protein [Butyricimonas]|uniref:TlpA disulfide reductase family protein n=1 Tax=Butyricimonas TaxID=574697 RepID=UPI001E3964B9|nr:MULTISPECIES: TlpA disulfide reductase family protein [Butyricimonas]
MMRKISLIIGLALLSSVACHAQEGYQISGKVSGMADGTLLLIANEGEKPDTLGVIEVKNGVFVFTGKVSRPAAAYLTPANGEGMIPLILENANFMVNVSGAGALIQGGKQQELLSRFTRISQSFMAEQAKVAAEARQPGANVQSLQARVDQAYEASVNATLDLIKANPDEYATAHVIALGIGSETEEGLRSKYELLGEAARATVPGKRIAAALEQYGKLAVGEVAPNFTLAKPDGNTFSLHDVPAKWKLVHFWAARVESSRRDNADLVKLYLQYRPRGLEIVSVALDDNHAMWKQAVGLDGMIWTNGSDLKGMDSGIARLYLVNDLPAYFLLDAENRVVARGMALSTLRDKLAELTRKRKK